MLKSLLIVFTITYHFQLTILYCDSSRSSAGGFCDLMYRVKNTFLPARLVASACKVSEGVGEVSEGVGKYVSETSISLQNQCLLLREEGETSCRGTVVTCFVFYLMRTKRRGQPRFNQGMVILCRASFPSHILCVLSYPPRRVNILLSLRSPRTEDKIEGLWIDQCRASLATTRKVKICCFWSYRSNGATDVLRVFL